MLSIGYEDARRQPELITSHFRSDGFLHLKNVFSRDECSNAVNAIKEFEKNIDASNSVRLVTEKIDDEYYTKYFQGAFELGDPLRRFFSTRLLTIGSVLLGNEDVFFADIEAHIRNPGGGEIPKHQDNFYFNLKDAKGMTCYIALTPHNSESGGLNYIHRSHAMVLTHDQSLCPGFSSSLDSTDYTGKIEHGKRVFSPEYNIGDVSIHHPNNIHYSLPADKTCDRGFALSVRIFSMLEEKDMDGVERYRRLLTRNRKIDE